MFILRGALGLICITIGIVGFAAAFEKPFALVITLIFVPLGLWIMGYITTFARPAAQARNDEEEIKIRSSRWFGLRNRAMGMVAVAIGGFGLGLAAWEGAPAKAILGGICLVGYGLYYLVRGRAAEAWYLEALKERRKKVRDK